MKNRILCGRCRAVTSLLAAGVLSVSGGDPPVPPRVELVATNPAIDVLSWPQSGTPFYLEEMVSLEPPRVWTPVDLEPETVDGVAKVLVPKTGGLRFFQLRHDPDLTTLLLDHGRQVAVDLPLVDAGDGEYLDLPFLDRFEPRRLGPLHGVPRVAGAGFVLTPGLWEIPLQTFCLKTGTPGPGVGTGFLPASFAGPRADVLQKILDAYSGDPTADQEETQILLWAVVVRTHLDRVPAAIRALADRWLSADDIRRLNAAADRKAALEAAFAWRYRRLLLGPGGLFEDLPPTVKEALQWDAEFEEALGRATELSYEDLQNLAFAAAPPPVPPGPQREIPYGRWVWMPDSDTPAGGCVARFLVLWYAETVVQFCVPEEITIETDGLGRITRLADRMGNEIVVGYDAAVAPLAVAGDAGLTGHAFDEIRLKGPPDPDDPRRLLAVTHQGTGWVFVGTPGGGGTPGAGARFPDPVGRYAFAVEQKAEVARLDRELSRVHAGRPPGRGTDAERLLNLAHFCEGLRLALIAAEPDDGPEFPHLADRLGLAQRAWVAEFARFCASGSGPGLLGSGPTPGWGARVRNFLNRLFPSRRQPVYFSPVNSGQQYVAPSYRPSNSQVQDYQTLNQQYQQALKPVDKLFWFLPMPDLFKVPRTVVTKGISWQLPWWEYAGRKIADPEGKLKPPWLMAGSRGAPVPAGPQPAGAGRADYDVPSVEVVWDPGPIEGSPGISPARLAAVREFVGTMLRVSAHLQAAALAMDRQWGAFEAGDELWYRLQGAYAVHQLRSAGAALWDVADAIERLTGVIRDEGTEDLWVTREEIEGIRQGLVTDGFPEETKAGFRAAGFTEAQIEACRQVSVDWAPDADGYPVLGALDGLGPVLREYGAWFLQFPAPFDPAAN